MSKKMIYGQERYSAQSAVTTDLSGSAKSNDKDLKKQLEELQKELNYLKHKEVEKATRSLW